MGSSFDLAIEIVLKREGGYVNDPNDRGHETNFGISKRTYPNVDIKGLTKSQAKEIYKKDWWEKYGYSLLVDQGIACKTFDMAVNMGSGVSHRILQHAVNTLSSLSLTLDGFMGPQTCNAANACHRGDLMASLRVSAVSHYHAIVAVHPEDNKYLNGWLKRATDSDGLIV